MGARAAPARNSAASSAPTATEAGKAFYRAARMFRARVYVNVPTMAISVLVCSRAAAIIHTGTSTASLATGAGAENRLSRQKSVKARAARGAA